MRVISGELIITTLRPHLPGITTVFIAVLGVAAIVFNTNFLLQVVATNPKSTAQSNNAAPRNKQAEAPFDAASISALNLFGTAVVQQSTDPAKLPATQLALKLTGIFASTQTEHSRVLIAEEGKTAKTFFAGDELSGQAILRSIGSDFVVLQRNDQLEKLLLHSPSIAQAVTQRRSPIAAITETPTAQAAIPTTSTTPSTPVGPQDLYRAMDARIAAIRLKNNPN